MTERAEFPILDRVLQAKHDRGEISALRLFRWRRNTPVVARFIIENFDIAAAILIESYNRNITNDNNASQ